MLDKPQWLQQQATNQYNANPNVLLNEGESLDFSNKPFNPIWGFDKKPENNAFQPGMKTYEHRSMFGPTGEVSNYFEAPQESELGQFLKIAGPFAAAIGGATFLNGGGLGNLFSNSATNLAGADALGGLLPEFGTNAAYSAGLGSGVTSGAATGGSMVGEGLGSLFNEGGSNLLNAFGPEGGANALGSGTYGLNSIPGVNTGVLNGLPEVGSEWLQSSLGLSDVGPFSPGAWQVYDGIKGALDIPTKVNSVYDVAKRIFGGGTGNNALGLLGGLAGLFSGPDAAEGKRNMVNGLIDRADPFGPQRPFYQKQLQQSYTDPVSIYNSPEMQALNKIFMDKISAKDAAAGRRSQYGDREIQARDNFLANLHQYRQDLQQPAGSFISPNNVLTAATLMQSPEEARQQALGNLMATGTRILNTPSEDGNLLGNIGVSDILKLIKDL